jgi:hypothetical protein
MKLRTFLLVAVVMASLFVVSSSLAQEGPLDPQAALGTAFTYQGRLTDGGAPANGAYDFEFRLYDSLSGTTQIGSAVVKDNVSVTGGVFTVQLDFGASAFAGEARWLQISVRAGSSSGAYTTLSPRQELTAAPYALYATRAPWSGLTSVPSGFADGVDNEGWALTGNSGTNASTNFVGTTNNVALTFRVSNTIGLRLVPSTGTPNVIGGHSANSVAANLENGTIGGGGSASNPNRITTFASYGTIGGGLGNTASGAAAVVGGGDGNTASGSLATIPGGREAVAPNWGQLAYASGRFVTAGDAQTSIYVMRGSSSGVTLSELFPGTGAGYINLADSRTLTFDILVVGRNATGESAGYEFRGVIERVGSTTAIVGSISKTVLAEDDTSWDVTVDANDATDYLRIRAQGGTDDTVRWVATVRTAEVAY